MVCDDCTKKLSTLAAPDPWKGAAGSSAGAGGAARRVDENKALRKGIRMNPYGNCCKLCKMKVQQNNATYCTQCAYAKGICAICGKQVLDTTMYKMSDGGNFSHTVKPRDEAAFKSEQQLARESAQNDLFEYLQSTGQVGRIPTKAALEAAGRGALATALLSSFGGLHNAADAMGLSKKLLHEEADERKVAKRDAAQHRAGANEEQRLAALEQQALLAEQGGEPSLAADPGAEGGDDDDLPPGVSGLYFQLSTQTYFDAGKSMYAKNGAWSREKPS